MKHVPLRESGYAIAVVAVLLALYGGAHLTIMTREVVGYNWMAGDEIPAVSYRFGGEWAEWFFTPAHAIDGGLRPDMWRREVGPEYARMLLHSMPVVKATR